MSALVGRLSTTAPLTRSACRPTVCWLRKSRTWTATQRSAPARYPCSRARNRRSGFSALKKRRLLELRNGSASVLKKALSPARLASLSALQRKRNRARAAVEAAGLEFKVLDEHVDTVTGGASISTM